MSLLPVNYTKNEFKKNILPRVYDILKEEKALKFRNAKHINLITDIWTDTNNA